MITKHPVATLLLLFVFTCSLKSQEPVAIQVDIGEAYQKGIAFMNANQSDKAFDQIFECYRSDPKHQDYLNRLGYCYFKLGNYLEAKYAFQEVLKEDSLNISATALFNKAHTLNQDDIATITDFASAYLELDALDYAQNIIDKGLVKDSSNLKVLFTYARIQNELDDYPAVIRSVGRAMELGDSTNYYAMMVSVAFLKTEQLDSCIYHLNRVIARERDFEHTPANVPNN